MATVFWDTYTSAGIFGGDGDWNTLDQNFSEDPDHFRTRFTQGDDVIFQGVAGDVDLTIDITVASMTIYSDNYAFYGPGSLSVMDGGSITVSDGKTASIRTALAGTGDFTVDGDQGNDILTGGADADVFMYRDLADLTGGGDFERITDFTQGEDRIRLKPVDANLLKDDRQEFGFIGENGFDGEPGQLRFELLDTTTLIMADLDGDEIADFTIVLDGQIGLELNDFLL